MQNLYSFRTQKLPLFLTLLDIQTRYYRETTSCLSSKKNPFDKLLIPINLSLIICGIVRSTIGYLIGLKQPKVKFLTKFFRTSNTFCFKAPGDMSPTSVSINSSLDRFFPYAKMCKSSFWEILKLGSAHSKFVIFSSKF